MKTLLLIFSLIACGTEPKAKSVNSATAATASEPTKGDKGDKGDQGPVGKDGAQGAAGVQGSVGATGVTGAPGYPGFQTVWVDPDSGDSWQFYAAAETFANAVCPSGWNIPITGALPPKFFRFFDTYFSVLPAGSSYWTNVIGTIGHVTYEVGFGIIGVGYADSPDTSKHMVICTKPATS